MAWKILCSILLFSSIVAAQQQSANAGSPITAGKETGSYSISGIVVDMLTGEALPKTEVSIVPVDGDSNTGDSNTRESTTVESAIDGHFSFTGVKNGKYLLTAHRRGYSRQAFEGHDELSTAIVTGPGLDSEHFVFHLRPDASIHGRITDEENDPVSSAMIYIAMIDSRTGERTMRLIRNSQTNDRGEYAVTHLPPGSYYLAVVARPWYASSQHALGLPESALRRSSTLDVAFPLTYYSDTTDPSAARPLNLQPGEQVTADFLLHSVPALVLRVPAEGGHGHASASVQVHQQLFGSIESFVPGTMVRKPDGSSEIGGLAAGEYIVSTLGAQEGQSTLQSINLQTDASMEATITPGYTRVSGTISYDGEAPKASAQIMLNQIKTDKTIYANVDAKNNFRFSEPLEPGAYEVMTHTGDWYIKRVAADGAKVNGRMVTLQGSAESQLKLSLSSGTGEVHGVVQLKDKPCAAAMVVLIPHDPKNNAALFRRDQSDSDGTFSLHNIVPGTYSLLALSGAWQLAWLSPEVLQPYLKKALPVIVQRASRQTVTLEVQSAQ